jgi:hypothetical protein
MLAADVVGRVLQKTKSGSPALEKLIAEDPSLKDAARMYFSRELFGLEGFQKNLTPAQYQTFLKNNEASLKAAGLFDDFANLAKARSTAQQTIERAEANHKLADQAVKSAEQESKAADATVAAKRSLAERASQREASVLTGKGTNPLLPVREKPGAPLKTPEDAAKAAADRAKEADKRLAEKAKEPETAAKTTEGKITELAKKKEAAEKITTTLTELKNHIDSITNKTLPDVVAKANDAADTLFSKGYISAEDHKKFVDQIVEVKTKLKDSAEARKRLLLLTGGLIVAAGTYMELGSYTYSLRKILFP